MGFSWRSRVHMIHHLLLPTKFHLQRILLQVRSHYILQHHDTILPNLQNTKRRLRRSLTILRGKYPVGIHQLIVYQYILQLVDTTLLTIEMKVVHQTIIKAGYDR